MRGYRSRLSRFERAIVESVAHRLPAADAERLRRRAGAVNRVQPLFGGMDTTFYQMRGSRAIFPAETCIVEYPRTVRFAKFRIRSDDPMTRLKGVMFLHAGNLSSIDFDQPTKFADADRIKEIDVEILGPPFIDPDDAAVAAGDWPVPDQ